MYANILNVLCGCFIFQQQKFRNVYDKILSITTYVLTTYNVINLVVLGILFIIHISTHTHTHRYLNINTYTTISKPHTHKHVFM